MHFTCAKSPRYQSRPMSSIPEDSGTLMAAFLCRILPCLVLSGPLPGYSKVFCNPTPCPRRPICHIACIPNADEASLVLHAAVHLVINLKGELYVTATLPTIDPILDPGPVPCTRPPRPVFRFPLDTQPDGPRAQFAFRSVVQRLEALRIQLACPGASFRGIDIGYGFVFAHVVPVFEFVRDTVPDITFKEFRVEQRCLERHHDQSTSRHNPATFP